MRGAKIGSACLIALLLAVWLYFPVEREEPAYYKHFKVDKSLYKQRFKKKIQAAAPAWMQEQIREDFSSFPAGRKISLDSLNAVEKALRQNNRIARYRIVNNRVYCSSIRSKDWEPFERFQIALQTLCRLTSLPNVDFMVNHEDGTAEAFPLPGSLQKTVPIFSWAKIKTLPGIVLIPDWRSLSTWWYDDTRKLVEGKHFHGKKLSWNEREEKAFWRGGYTEHTHRVKIAELSILYPQLIDAGLTTDQAHLASFSKPSASYEEHMKNKYLPTLDGIMCSYPGYQWRLLSGSAVFKQESDQIQWFYKALQPYVHYIPIQNDLSDLVEKIEWAKSHDTECAEMAEEGKKFALENLLFDDIYYYFYLVLLEYAGRLDTSFNIEWKKTEKDPDWIRL